MAKKRNIWIITLTAFAFTMFFSGNLFAQKYNFAVGWRSGGMTNGVTAKLVTRRGVAFEGIMNLYPYGNAATLLIEESRPLICCFPALQIYGGIGAHYRWNYRGGVFSDPVFGTVEGYGPEGSITGFGMDATAGIEWKLPLLPLAVSADIKPMIEFTNTNAVFYGLDPGLGVKLAF